MSAAKPTKSGSIAVPLERGWRRITAGLRLLPDWLIIGTQKGGTTSLYEYLITHPDVGGASRKEVHFFDLKWEKGVDWYRTHFPTTLQAQARERETGRPFHVLEGTPYYMFHPAAPERVRQVLPEVRLMAVLRNPVDRALSHYHHERRAGRETLTFEEAIERETERLSGTHAGLDEADEAARKHHWRHAYLARGRYAEQLERWLRAFPREQLLVLNSERFYADTAAEMERVMRWLNVPPIHPATYDRRNAGGEYGKLDPVVRQRLEEYFAPYNERLYELLGERWDW